jgi:hypothetical protein
MQRLDDRRRQRAVAIAGIRMFVRNCRNHLRPRGQIDL